MQVNLLSISMLMHISWKRSNAWKKKVWRVMQLTCSCSCLVLFLVTPAAVPCHYLNRIKSYYRLMPLFVNSYLLCLVASYNDSIQLTISYQLFSIKFAKEFNSSVMACCRCLCSSTLDSCCHHCCTIQVICGNRAIWSFLCSKMLS